MFKSTFVTKIGKGTDLYQFSQRSEGGQICTNFYKDQNRDRFVPIFTNIRRGTDLYQFLQRSEERQFFSATRTEFSSRRVGENNGALQKVKIILSRDSGVGVAFASRSGRVYCELIIDSQYIKQLAR